MIKQIYKQRGWTATSTVVRHNCVEVKLTIDHRYNFCCPKCHSVLKTHLVRDISVRDLPFADKDVILFIDTMQGYCFRYHINSARIESANASIKRIQAKACGLFDCEVSVLEAAPDLLSEAPKKAQDFTFLLPADLKQPPLFLCRLKT